MTSDTTKLDATFGESVVGRKLTIGERKLYIHTYIAKGDFSYFYHVKQQKFGTSTTSTSKEEVEAAASSETTPSTSTTVADDNDKYRKQSKKRGPKESSKDPSEEYSERSSASSTSGKRTQLRFFSLKVTPMISKEKRKSAEKEAALLMTLAHPSIVKVYDSSFVHLDEDQCPSVDEHGANQTKRPQHILLMEFCDGGYVQDACHELISKGQRFDLITLLLTFGQICNAVSYLHSSRETPIVHRNLKPTNFGIQRGTYKLCNFDSAILGHVDIKTKEEKEKAAAVIAKTTTASFRAPEMVDLNLSEKLTQATDIWALGCSLYALAFLRNCFQDTGDDRKLNRRILSGKYRIPAKHPYGNGLTQLLSRMLEVNYKYRADMREVILCLSAIYGGQPLPPRKRDPTDVAKQKAEDSTKRDAASEQARAEDDR